MAKMSSLVHLLVDSITTNDSWFCPLRLCGSLLHVFSTCFNQERQALHRAASANPCSNWDQGPSGAMTFSAVGFEPATLTHLTNTSRLVSHVVVKLKTLSEVFSTKQKVTESNTQFVMIIETLLSTWGNCLYASLILLFAE